MKRPLVLMSSLALLICCALPLFAQIPNPGFENWTNNNPDGWITTNAPPTYTNVTRTTTAHSGSAALRGEVVSVFAVPIPPLIQSGTGGDGFTFTQRPASLTGYYQFSPASGSGNRFFITVVLTKGGIGQTAVAAGTTTITAATSGYVQFSAPISYVSPLSPDTAYIQMLIGGPSTGGQATAGSYFIVDDLAFSGTASAVEADAGNGSYSFALQQNYPNPFNPSTNQFLRCSAWTCYAQGL